jgi:hypothetical protein
MKTNLPVRISLNEQELYLAYEGAQLLRQHVRDSYKKLALTKYISKLTKYMVNAGFVAPLIAANKIKGIAADYAVLDEAVSMIPVSTVVENKEPCFITPALEEDRMEELAQASKIRTLTVAEEEEMTELFNKQFGL